MNMGSINCLAFNQDFSGIGVGTNKGIRIYHTDPFRKSYSGTDDNILQVEMFYLSSLVAIVPAPRLLRLINLKKNTTIVELTFPTMILAVRMNRNHLAVVLQERIHLYDIGNINALREIDTPPNAEGICALSTEKDKSILAYPCPLKQTAPPAATSPSHVPPGSQEWHHAVSQDMGDVRIYDAQKMQAINTIQAHKSRIGYLCLNKNGTRLATASEKGTIIRVFEVPGGSGNQPLFEFRRGTSQAKIYHMSFNDTSTLLCVSSQSETIHIFKLEKPAPVNTEMSPPVSPGVPSHRRTLSSSSRERSESVSSEDLAETTMADEMPPSLERRSSGIAANLASRLRQASQSVGAGVAARVGGYLPQSVTQGFEAQRDFAHVKIPKATASSAAIKSIVAMSPNHPHLYVVTSEGQFGVYNIDMEKGGDGVLERQHSIHDSGGGMAYSPDD